MARESFAFIYNCEDQLVWNQLRAELIAKVVLGGTPVEALIVTRAGSVIMAGGRTQVETEANRISNNATYSWAESYNLKYSLRSCIQYITGVSTVSGITPKVCIKSNGPSLGGLLSSMLCKEFYSGDRNLGEEAYRIDSGDYIRRGTWASMNAANFSDYTKLDANNPADLNRLRTMLGFRPINMDKPETVSDISQCVSSGLAQFIQANPQDEMVLGFLLKETGMRLPKEVQTQGLETITKFILDETNARLVKQFEAYKAGEAASPKLPEPATSTHLVFYTESQYISGRMRFTRTDEQRYMVNVPDSVWQEAAEDGDVSIIWDWINDNDAAEPQGDVVEGDEEYGDTIDSGISDSENGMLENPDGTPVRF